jgi:hypothetical protein
MERRDRAADAVHAEIEKDADGRRPSPHDFVDGQFGCQERDPCHDASLAVRRHGSLRWRKQGDDSSFVGASSRFERLLAADQTALA